MARTRVELHKILKATLGTNNVYFDPPESFKLKYPCIVYSLGGHVERFSENSVYHRLKRYNLIYITQDADDPMVETLEDLEYCHLSRPYTSDGLFHYAYDIYF
jgi:hypothetical protein